MKEESIEYNSIKAWILAARPKTLTGAAVPIMVATALAWHNHTANATATDCSFNILATVLCFLFAFIMQIDANFVNDYYDCIRGNDNETRLGPKRACAQGWVTLSAMRKALLLTTLAGCATGLPLAFIGGWPMILVGAACVLFCFLYTTTLSYLGLGDVLVLVFFGLVPTCCSYYVITGSEITSECWALSVAVGLIIDTLLIINNYRDLDNDREAGKRTLAVMIGRKSTKTMYLLIVPLALLIFALTVKSPLSIVFSLLILIIHIKTWKRMVDIDRGAELNRVLGMTARNMFIFGFLSSVAIILT